MSQYGIERDGKSGGVRLGVTTREVRPMSMGIDGVEVSAIILGESPLMWRCFWLPNLEVALAPEMCHPPKIPQKQWNSNRMGFQRVPVANPLNADVVSVANPFF